MGLIERENATILNAALYQVAERFTDGFARSLADEGVTNAEIYLSQNDGTLMTMEHARKYPILTIACGPTNPSEVPLTSARSAMPLSLMWAAPPLTLASFRTGSPGIQRSGHHRRRAHQFPDAGYRFHRPGRRFYRPATAGRSGHGGPDSVGYQITSKALVFGGDTVTATDIAVRLGMAQVGDPAKVADLDLDLAQKALQAIQNLVEDCIDTMKVSNADVDAVLVGGGSIILPKNNGWNEQRQQTGSLWLC